LLVYSRILIDIPLKLIDPGVFPENHVTNPGFHHPLKHFRAFIILSSIPGLSSSSQAFPGFHHSLKHFQAFIILSSIPAEGRVTVSLRRSIIFFEFEIII